MQSQTKNIAVGVALATILALQTSNFMANKELNHKVSNLDSEIKKTRIELSKDKTKADLASTTANVSKLQEQVSSQQSELKQIEKGLSSLINIGNFQ